MIIFQIGTSYNIILLILDSDFNDNLKNKIALIAGSFVKSKEVASDGDCGIYALKKYK